MPLITALFAFQTSLLGAADAAPWISFRSTEAPLPIAQWVSRAPCPKTGAYGEAITSTGDALWAVRDATAASTPYFWRYDPGVDLWEERDVSTLPDGVFRNGTALAWDGGDRLYALAGARYEDSDRTDFWRYELVGDTWTQIEPTPGPQGAGDALVYCDLDASLYAILGSRSHGTTFARYDLAQQSWSELTAPPERTDDGASLAWGGGTKLYALAGEYSETVEHFDFWEYDLLGDEWSALADVPDPGGVGDGASLLWAGGFDPRLEDTLYALSGGSVDETAGVLAHRYSIALDQWSPLADLPCEIGYYNGTRLAFADGYLYCWQGGRSGFLGGGRMLVRLE